MLVPHTHTHTHTHAHTHTQTHTHIHTHTTSHSHTHTCIISQCYCRFQLTNNNTWFFYVQWTSSALLCSPKSIHAPWYAMVFYQKATNITKQTCHSCMNRPDLKAGFVCPSCKKKEKRNLGFRHHINATFPFCAAWRFSSAHAVYARLPGSHLLSDHGNCRFLQFPICVTKIRHKDRKGCWQYQYIRVIKGCSTWLRAPVSSSPIFLT